MWSRSSLCCFHPSQPQLLCWRTHSCRWGPIDVLTWWPQIGLDFAPKWKEPNSKQTRAHCCLLTETLEEFPFCPLALTDMKDHDVVVLLCTYRTQPFWGKEKLKKQELWLKSGLVGLATILCAPLTAATELNSHVQAVETQETCKSLFLRPSISQMTTTNPEWGTGCCSSLAGPGKELCFHLSMTFFHLLALKVQKGKHATLLLQLPEVVILFLKSLFYLFKRQ